MRTSVTIAPRFTSCRNCHGDMIKVHPRTQHCSDECRAEGKRRSWRLYGARNRPARRAYLRDLYNRDPAAKIAKTRAYQATPAGKRAQRVSAANQKARHPERVAARQAVTVAVRSGRLVRQPCACGEEKTHAHHDDYSKPLDVRWMCEPCHRAEHRRNPLGDHLMKSDILDLEVSLLAVSPSGLAIRVTSPDLDEPVWLPLSMIEVEGDISPGERTITIPKWLAEERGLA